MRLATLAILLSVAVVCADAEINPLPGEVRIVPEFDSADVVCAGVVKSVQEDSRTIQAPPSRNERGHTMVGIVEVRDIYKPPTLDAEVLRVEFQEESGGRSSGLSLRPGENVLLFLNRNALGGYRLESRLLGATELAIEPSTAVGSGIEKLERSLSNALSKTGGYGTLTALHLLGGFDRLDQATANDVTPLCYSTDPQTRFSALVVILKSENPTSLELLKRSLDSYTGQEQPLELISVGNEIGEFHLEPSRHAMEAFSDSTYYPIRLGALKALRAMRNPQSSPTFVKHLDDPNDYIRYLTVITLAEIYPQNGGDYAPSMYLFDKKPSYYTGLWKKWWQEQAHP